MAATVVIFNGFHVYLALVVGTVGAAAKQATEQIQAGTEDAMANSHAEAAALEPPGQVRQCVSQREETIRNGVVSR